MRRERGQVLVMAPVMIVLIVALGSVLVEGGLWWGHLYDLQNDLDAACIAAAIAETKGLNYGTAFVASMRANEVEDEYFSPYENGPDGMVMRGVTYGPSSTIVAGASGDHDTYLVQFAGIRRMTVAVRSRCRIPDAGVLPICVKRPDVDEGLTSGQEYVILGQGVEATESRGSSFSGACVTQIWCDNTDCEPKTFFEPTSDGGGLNQFKDVWADTVAELVGTPYVPIGTIIPVLDGVSNSFEAQTVDEQFDIGDTVYLMQYSGIVEAPSPNFGNWENVEVEAYIRAEITAMDGNTIWARFLERIDNLDMLRAQTTVRTVQWEWAGEIPE
jgi:hypothetical protein